MNTDAARLTERTLVLYYNRGKCYARLKPLHGPLPNSRNRLCRTPSMITLRDFPVDVGVSVPTVPRALLRRSAKPGKTLRGSRNQLETSGTERIASPVLFESSQAPSRCLHDILTGRIHIMLVLRQRSPRHESYRTFVTSWAVILSGSSSCIRVRGDLRSA